MKLRLNELKENGVKCEEPYESDATMHLESGPPAPAAAPR